MSICSHRLILFYINHYFFGLTKGINYLKPLLNELTMVINYLYSLLKELSIKNAVK